MVKCMFSKILWSFKGLWQRTEEELTRELIIKGEKEGIKVKVKDFFRVSCSQYDIYFEEGKIYLSSKEQTAPIHNFLKCMEKEPDHSVCIAEQDVPAFCRDLLPKLELLYVCHNRTVNVMFNVSFIYYKPYLL